MTDTSSIGRREFIGAVGAGVAAAAWPAADAQAQAPLKVVDFHNHFVGPSFALTTSDRAAPAQRANQARVDALLADPGALLGSLETTGVTARVINTPTAFLEDADGEVPTKVPFPRINDQLAKSRRHESWQASMASPRSTGIVATRVPAY